MCFWDLLCAVFPARPCGKIGRRFSKVFLNRLLCCGFFQAYFIPVTLQLYSIQPVGLQSQVLDSIFSFCLFLRLAVLRGYSWHYTPGGLRVPYEIQTQVVCVQGKHLTTLYFHSGPRTPLMWFSLVSPLECHEGLQRNNALKNCGFKGPAECP